MFLKTHILKLAALGALLTFAAFNAPASAEEMKTNFGPVGPSEPVLATIGGQHVIAYFAPERGACAVSAIVWKDARADAPYASSRVKLSLRPGAMVQFDGAREASMKLLCGEDASTLSVVAPAELVLTGATSNSTSN
jgi:hypothetical protein